MKNIYTTWNNRGIDGLTRHTFDIVQYLVILQVHALITGDVLRHIIAHCFLQNTCIAVRFKQLSSHHKNFIESHGYRKMHVCTLLNINENIQKKKKLPLKTRVEHCHVLMSIA